MNAPSPIARAGLIDVFRSRRVLVTGHTGFKGSWLVTWLNQLGAKVTGLALPTDSGSLFDRCGLDQRLAHRIGDIRSLEVVRKVVDEAQPEIVFHLAAQPLVRRSFADPLETITTNVTGTAHVLEAIRLRNAPCAVVVVTSDKCYEAATDGHAHLETDPMGGHDPYSMSKGAAELVCASYRHSFFAREPSQVLLATARAGNCIGGGDVSVDRLVVDAVKAFTAGKPVELRNPSYIRPWQHVVDPLYGYLMLAARLLGGKGASEFADAFNFGPPAADAATVKVVVELLIENWGEGAKWVDVSGQAKPPENPLLMLNTRKAQSTLGWLPKLTLIDAVEWTVEWYRAANEGKDMLATTRRQLEQFMERLPS